MLENSDSRVLVPRLLNLDHMQKPDQSTRGNAGSCHTGIKPWPLGEHLLRRRESARIGDLHARFNPQLVGFGIAGSSFDECIEERGKQVRVPDGARDPDSGEQK